MYDQAASVCAWYLRISRGVACSCHGSLLTCVIGRVGIVISLVEEGERVEGVLLLVLLLLILRSHTSRLRVCPARLCCLGIGVCLRLLLLLLACILRRAAGSA